MKILYVEDDDDLRTNFLEVLKLNYEDVFVAKDGLEAKELFDRIAPDAVITDINMPRMNGIELARYVKSKDKSVYLIITTAYNDADNLLNAINAGVDKFLIKPISLETFDALFTTILPTALESHTHYIQTLDNSIFLQKIFNSIDHGILVLDKQGIVQKVNTRLCTLFGYPKEELVGKHFTLLLFDDQKEKTQSIYEERFQNSDTFIEEMWVLRKKDSTPISVMASICMFYDTKNTPYQLTSFRDLTQELALIAENKLQEEMLIQQGKLASMGEVLNQVAHQWRQPLNSLILMLGNLKDAHDFEELSADGLDQFIENAKKQIMFMSQTIDDFRNFFKPETEKELFCVFDAIEEMLDIVRPELLKNAITIHKTGHPPDAKEGCSNILSYKNALKQVMLNLINNAKDAIHTHQPKKGEITIDICKKSSDVVVTIGDNGGGIPPNILPQIFNPYFSTKGPKIGTGIGLYMSKNLVEKYLGGSIEASNTDNGALFTITLHTTRN